MTAALRLLVVDGYTLAGRDEFREKGATPAGELYQAMLKACSPVDVDITLLHPADADARLPDRDELASYDGVAWTGCSLCLNDDIPEVRRQVGLAKLGFEVGVPGFGSCWAAQIAVVAGGGCVAPNPSGREQGISRKIALNSDGASHPMFVGKPAVFDAFTSHDDHITLMPKGAVNLCSNPWTQVQAVHVELLGTEFWGVQYHPEYTLHELARITEAIVDLFDRRHLSDARATPRSPEINEHGHITFQYSAIEIVRCNLGDAVAGHGTFRVKVECVVRANANEFYRNWAGGQYRFCDTRQQPRKLEILNNNMESSPREHVRLSG